jgi:hypothetical protein
METSSIPEEDCDKLRGLGQSPNSKKIFSVLLLFLEENLGRRALGSEDFRYRLRANPSNAKAERVKAAVDTVAGSGTT